MLEKVLAVADVSLHHSEENLLVMMTSIAPLNVQNLQAESKKGGSVEPEAITSHCKTKMPWVWPQTELFVPVLAPFAPVKHFQKLII